MKLAAIADKVGRVQHSRMLLLKDVLKGRVDIDVFVPEDNIRFRKYDAVYFTHFNISKKVKYSGPALASITSHKCLQDVDATTKFLRRFRAVSVNNRILYNIFERRVRNLYLTVNGVDTDFFSLSSHPRHDPPVFGWCGNRDREAKNYHIVRQLKKHYAVKEVAPSKKDSMNKLLTKSQMRDFYHAIDFFLVTSSTEGTPNPGLEAMSCGVIPVTTKVGNMVEIVREGATGFYAEPSVESFMSTMDRIVDGMTDSDFHNMTMDIRSKMVKEWDWKIVAKHWEQFFKHQSDR